MNDMGTQSEIQKAVYYRLISELYEFLDTHDCSDETESFIRFLISAYREHMESL